MVASCVNKKEPSSGRKQRAHPESHLSTSCFVSGCRFYGSIGPRVSSCWCGAGGWLDHCFITLAFIFRPQVETMAVAGASTSASTSALRRFGTSVLLHCVHFCLLICILMPRHTSPVRLSSSSLNVGRLRTTSFAYFHFTLHSFIAHCLSLA